MAVPLETLSKHHTKEEKKTFAVAIWNVSFLYHFNSLLKHIIILDLLSKQHCGKSHCRLLSQSWALWSCPRFETCSTDSHINTFMFHPSSWKISKDGEAHHQAVHSRRVSIVVAAPWLQVCMVPPRFASSVHPNNLEGERRLVALIHWC